MIADGNPDSDSDRTTPENRKLVVWTLQPGEINRLEAIFWVPSPVGIGTAIIVLFAYFGFLLKYRLLSPTTTPAANNNQPVTSDN
ncbi:DUF3153 domain-containing protein [Arthrospira sp. PCC 9108]|nr:DUF3153 domain-containing protein [Arthrospira sp. PCC 9108]